MAVRAGIRGFAHRAVGLVPIVGALGLAAALGPDALGAPQAVHEVAIDGTRFVPAEITVERGASVRWVNKDPFPHTVTAPGVFDSKAIAPGRSWSWVARRPGRYDYVCTLHPNMKGTVVVR